MRSKSGVPRNRRKKKLFRAVKGFVGGRRRLLKSAKETLLRAGMFAFRDRRAKKRDFRRLFITRLSAAAEMRGLRYSRLIHGLRLANIGLDRKSLSELAIHDPDVHDATREANLRKGVRLTAVMPTVVTAHERLRKGKEPLAPDPSLSHAANFLYMLTGTRPDDLGTRALDVAMLLQLDHGLNASTFAARVTGGTLADMHAAITSAIGTLKGPLHGGANHDVMVMLRTIGEVDKAADFVRTELLQKKKIPGFGHRVYKTLDPRAIHLRDLSERLGKSRSAVANTLRALQAPQILQDAVQEGKITEGHLRALLPLPLSEAIRALGEILAKGMSVREAESLARKMVHPTHSRRRTRAKGNDPDLAGVTAELRSALGTKVEITKGRKGGRIAIQFYSDEDFERLYELLVRAGPK